MGSAQSRRAPPHGRHRESRSRTGGRVSATGAQLTTRPHRRESHRHGARRARRTNAERSGQTRDAILAAAIRLLCTRGHAATTTIEVAARARVSRGAMLHHFPTRNELLLAVAQAIITEQSEQRRQRIDLASTGLKRFYSSTDINWEIQKQPGTIALIEIMMATRSDSPLRKAIAPLVGQMAQLRAQSAALVASDLGVSDTETIATMLYLHQVTMRGLAMHFAFTGDSERIEAAQRLFTTYQRAFADSLMMKKKPSAPENRRD